MSRCGKTWGWGGKRLIQKVCWKALKFVKDTEDIGSCSTSISVRSVLRLGLHHVWDEIIWEMPQNTWCFLSPPQFCSRRTDKSPSGVGRSGAEEGWVSHGLRESEASRPNNKSSTTKKEEFSFVFPQDLPTPSSYTPTAQHSSSSSLKASAAPCQAAATFSLAPKS